MIVDRASKRLGLPCFLSFPSPILGRQGFILFSSKSLVGTANILLTYAVMQASGPNLDAYKSSSNLFLVPELLHKGPDITFSEFL